MKTNSSFHAAGEVATQPAWGTGEQAAQPLNGSTSRFAMSESSSLISYRRRRASTPIARRTSSLTMTRIRLASPKP